jgi:uncharacterized protein (TIGR02594 family)
MSFGSDSVSNLQRFLNGKLQPSPGLLIDGVLGPRTREALQRYEEVRARIGTDGALIDAHLSRDHVWLGTPEGWTEPGDNEAAGGAGPHAWMAIAEGEIGVSQTTGRGSHAARIAAYRQAAGGEAGGRWDSAFVNWVLRRAGHVGTGNAAPASWIGWGIGCTPRYGAVAVLRAVADGPPDAAGYHVGFLTSAQSNKVRLLGSDRSDKVKFSNFSKARFEPIALRWPG